MAEPYTEQGKVDLIRRAEALALAAVAARGADPEWSALAVLLERLTGCGLAAIARALLESTVRSLRLAADLERAGVAGA